MNKKMFSGWQDVFAFTFKQSINGKSFKPVTIGMMLFLLIGGMAISIIMAFIQKEEETEVLPIKTVHVINDSGLNMLYFEGFQENYNTRYPDISFAMEEGSFDEVNKAVLQQLNESQQADSEQSDNYDVIMHVCEEGEGYMVKLYIPEKSSVSKDDGESFLDDIIMAMEQSKLMSSDISMEKLVFAMSNVSSTILEAGEDEKSMGEEMVTMLLPMVFVLFLYSMTALYGQSIGNVVSMEKCSKLMEMMLTMTRPYALISGKILAMVVTAILQMVAWIGSFVGGFFLGHIVAKEMIYTEYHNLMIEIVQLLSNQEGSTAFSVGAFVLAFVTICLSFLFYSVLAGMISSFATKAENLSQMMGIYMMIVLVGFLGAYTVPVQESEMLTTIMRIIPVTSAFLLPGDLVVGNITVVQGILYMAILLVTTVVLVVIAGKIYKNQLFYKGTSFKMRFMRKKKVNS